MDLTYFVSEKNKCQAGAIISPTPKEEEEHAYLLSTK